MVKMVKVIYIIITLIFLVSKAAVSEISKNFVKEHVRIVYSENIEKKYVELVADFVISEYRIIREKIGLDIPLLVTVVIKQVEKDDFFNHIKLLQIKFDKEQSKKEGKPVLIFPLFTPILSESISVKGNELFIPTQDQILNNSITISHLLFVLPHELTEFTLILPNMKTKYIGLDYVGKDNETIRNYCFSKNIGMVNADTRWFREGIADYAGFICLREMAENVYRLVRHERFKILAMYNKKIDLFKWYSLPPEGEKANYSEIVEVENPEVYYSAASCVILYLTEKYTENIIPKILDKLKNLANPTSDDICNIIKEITGEDFKKNIGTICDRGIEEAKDFIMKQQLRNK